MCKESGRHDQSEDEQTPSRANKHGPDAESAPIERQQRAMLLHDPDTALLEDLAAMIRTARRRRRASINRHCNTTRRVLILGYAGAGNTGADIRVIETIRQLRCLSHGRPLELTIFAMGALLDHSELRTVRILQPGSTYLPYALEKAIDDYDVVLNAEGSTYTSTFSDALSGWLIGGLGYAAALGRVACAYGVDAGAMTNRLQRFAMSASSGVDIVCRSESAVRQLTALGLTVERGADAAWAFRANAGSRPPLPARYVALCPNNPYWWPVFTDVRRAFEDDAAGAQSPLRHGPYTFHSWDDTRAAHFAEYKRGFAAIAHGLQKRGYSPVLVAMERLDREACQEIAALLPCGVPIVARGDQTLDAVAATLEGAACVVTTRYHASLLAIANATPVIGVSMDSRINNLFRENALADWIVSCDMPAFEHAVLERIDAGTSTDLDRLREKYTSISQRERRTLATMGTRLVARIHAASP